MHLCGPRHFYDIASAKPASAEESVIRGLPVALQQILPLSTPLLLTIRLALTSLIVDSANAVGPDSPHLGCLGDGKLCALRARFNQFKCIMN